MKLTDYLKLVKSWGQKNASETFSQEEKTEIERVYFEVFRRKMRTCQCKNKYHDAILEMYNYLKNIELKGGEMTKSRLKRGVVLYVGNGKYYTNSNLTDEVAAEYLAKYPRRVGIFEVLPPMPETPTVEVVEEVPQTKKKKKKSKKDVNPEPTEQPESVAVEGEEGSDTNE